MDKTDFVSIFVLLMLTIMLPEIVTGDKVVYNNEHEGVVTNIESPLGYQQFTVKLLNGLTRICARYQIAKIDNYFSENGPTDDEWMDIISASLLPEGRPLSSVSEPTVGDWDAMNNEVTDDEAVGALPSDEDWHAIDIALSEPLAMCPDQETLTSAPTPVSTATKSISSAGQEHGTNVTLAPSTSSRRKKTVSFADPISSFIVAQTTRGSKASTPRTRAGRVALDIMTVQHDEPQPHTSGTGQRFTEPHTHTSGTGQRFTEPRPHTSGTGQRFTEPRSSTSGTGQRFTEPRSSTSGPGQRFTEPRSSTSGTGQRFTEPQPHTRGTGQRFTEPWSSTSGTGQRFTEPQPSTSRTGQRFTEPQPSTSGTGQRFTEPQPSTSGTGQRFTEPQPSASGTGQRFTEPQPSTSGTGQRFTDVSRADVTNFILDHENSNTASKTKGHVNLLKSFILQLDDNRDIHDIPPVELNTYLARFFLSVRSKNGSEYEPSTLRGMLGSFIRHLNRKSYNVSLLDDVRFSSMRESLKSKQKQLKKIGKGNRPMRAEPLTHTELDKLYESQQLGLSTPSSLLHTLWFNNCTHFGLRGGKQEHRGLCWGGMWHWNVTVMAVSTWSWESGKLKPGLAKIFAMSAKLLHEPGKMVKIQSDVQSRLSCFAASAPRNTVVRRTRFILRLYQQILFRHPVSVGSSVSQLAWISCVPLWAICAGLLVCQKTNVWLIIVLENFWSKHWQEHELLTGTLCKWLDIKMCSQSGTIVKSPKKTTGALAICCVATGANHLQLQTFQWQAQAVLVLKDPQTQLPNSPNFKPNSPNFKPNGPNFKPNSPNFQPYSPNFQPNSPNFEINSLGRMWCRQSTQQHIQQLGKCSPIAKLERWSLTIISPPPRPEPEWVHLENGPGASSSPILTVVRIVSDITKSYQNFTYVNMFVGSALRSWILEF